MKSLFFSTPNSVGGNGRFQIAEVGRGRGWCACGGYLLDYTPKALSFLRLI